MRFQCISSVFFFSGTRILSMSFREMQIPRPRN
jgi:hypothetical protein